MFSFILDHSVSIMCRTIFRELHSVSDMKIYNAHHEMKDISLPLYLYFYYFWVYESAIAGSVTRDQTGRLYDSSGFTGVVHERFASYLIPRMTGINQIIIIKHISVEFPERLPYNVSP